MTRSLIGCGPNAVSDYSPQEPFPDIVKSIMFFGSVSSPQSRADKAGTLLPDAPPLDPNGWPRADFAAYLKRNACWPGTYKLVGEGFKARPTLQLPSTRGSVQNVVWDQNTQRLTADLTINTDANQICLRALSTGGGCSRLSVYLPGYGPDSGSYTKEFEAALAPFGVIRGMSIQKANGDLRREPGEMTRPDQATWINGVPFAWLVELARRNDKSLWANIPVGASDALVEYFAKAALEGLPRDAEFWWERGNETAWNWIFDQCDWNYAEAQRLVATGDPLGLNVPASDKNVWRWLFHVWDTIRMSLIFRRVWADESYRLRGVIGAQYGDVFYLEMALNWAAEKVKKELGGVSGFGPDLKIGDLGIVATGIAPYAGGSDIAFLSRKDLTAEDVVRFNLAEAAAFPKSDKFARHLALAAKHKLGVVGYEVANALGDYHNTEFPDPADPTGKKKLDVSRAAKILAMSDPREMNATGDYLKRLLDGGLSLAMCFSFIDDFGKTFYGLTDDIRNLEKPKYKGAAISAAASQAPRPQRAKPPRPRPSERLAAVLEDNAKWSQQIHEASSAQEANLVRLAEELKADNW